MVARDYSFRQRQLGRALRRARDTARMSQQEVADFLEYSISKVSRFEAGQTPDLHALRTMLDRFGLLFDEIEPYIEMWRRAKAKGWWHEFGYEPYGYVSMEAEASEVWEFNCLIVPGILQTAAYTRHSFEMGDQPPSRAMVDREIAVRTRRRQRLTDSDARLVFHAVIDESVLRESIPPEIMLPQLEKIIELAGLDNVTVQILPVGSGMHSGKRGPFIVLAFPDRDEPDRGYNEHAFGPADLDGVDDAEKVKAVRLRFNRLAARALSAEDSLALLKRLAAEL